jgi:hypothetical protein
VERVAEVIDEVLLQREVVPSKAWEAIVEAARAAHVGLPVLRIYPKLVAFDSRYHNELVQEIVSRLSSRDEDRVGEGFLTLNNWADQLADSRIPRIPDIVIIGMIGRLDGEYFTALIHVLDTIGNLLRRLPAGQAKRLLNRCEPLLERWAQRLSYEFVGRHPTLNPRLRTEVPDLRASMTRLCVIAQSYHLESNAITRWLESVRDDPMPEIRRALVEKGS